MADVEFKGWNPFGVSFNLRATNKGVTRISATQFQVTIYADWGTYWAGNSTNYGMQATSGGKTIYIPQYNGKNHSSGSGTLTGTYSISGYGSQTKTVTVRFTNYKTDSSTNSSAYKDISFNVTVPAWPSYTVSYNANGGSGAPGNQTKYKNVTLTLSSTKPTRTGHNFSKWNTNSGGTGTNYSAGGSYTANAAVTLYAQWTAHTYTVSYNANGGSGAPGNQTKTYGKTLTLSSTKPTRTGYSFQGWATSASGSVAYTAGGSYTGNSAVTLYAVWKANTYTVSYNANGGSGAPGNQTKTYGTVLKLSTVVPTKTNYNFLGWATSASATTATYTAGGNYTNNSAVTLYAVWELAYVKPRIKNLTVVRCNYEDVFVPVEPLLEDGKFAILSDISTYDKNDIEHMTSVEGGTTTEGYQVYYCTLISGGDAYVCIVKDFVINDSGHTVLMSFDWECDGDVNCVRIIVRESNDEVYKEYSSLNGSFVASGNSGSVRYGVQEHTVFDPDKSYTFEIEVNDYPAGGSQKASTYRRFVTLSGQNYPIDVLAGGKGVAIGKPAMMENTLDIGYQTMHNGGFMYPTIEPGADLNDYVDVSNIYIGGGDIDIRYENAPEGLVDDQGFCSWFILEVMYFDRWFAQQKLTLINDHMDPEYNPITFTRWRGGACRAQDEWSEWQGEWKYPELNYSFTMYGTSLVDNQVKCRRHGNLVELRGVVTPINDIEYGTSARTICFLDDPYRPDSPINVICQGSGNCIWTLSIKPDGEVGFARYRNGSTSTTCTPGTWLPFQVTYYCQDYWRHQS